MPTIQNISYEKGVSLMEKFQQVLVKALSLGGIIIWPYFPVEQLENGITKARHRQHIYQLQAV